MIMVYHSKDFSKTCNYGYPPHLTIDSLLQGLDDSSLYEHVADIDSDDLETAYHLTNHITSNWTENAGVDAAHSEVRSSSIGDLFIAPDGIYVVARCGFDKIRNLDN